MMEYNHIEVQSLSAGPKLSEDPSERSCPACGKQKVRNYRYRSSRQNRPIQVTYMWCAACHRFKGWTGPLLGEFNLSDPLAELTPAERQHLTNDPQTLFARLDQLWEVGQLPQRPTKNSR